ncbi:MAG: hypothetical protein L0212_03835 [Acidobacteria bacterium]|nr:hypothetical protein [Acidobacteriota bacterium]
MSDVEKEPKAEGKAEKVKQNQVVRVACKSFPSSLNGTRCKVIKAEKDGSLRVEVLEGPQKGEETTVYGGDYEAA